MPLQPEITAPELATTKTRLETILAQKIAITIDGQVVAPNASDIGNWLVLKPTSKTMDIAVDGDKVQAYLKQLASDHSHAARTQIALDGGSKIVQTGQRGVSVGDTQAAAAAIQQQALTGAGLSLTLPVTYTAFKTVSAPTAGKWIEVDTTTKHMYAYDQGELVRSFLVSAGAPATPTVTGSFAIYAKYRTQDMFGENVDGSNYFQPAVPYVNYFYRDYAIHGNYWRPASYFGHINSSHGCVGVPVDDGAWVYSWAPIGTPVIVHT
jgi:lipoprotein-anchoring transpeptidase ErfK/SrfK